MLQGSEGRGARTLALVVLLLRLLQQAQLLLDRLERRLALLHDVRVLGSLQLALELLPNGVGRVWSGVRGRHAGQHLGHRGTVQARWHWVYWWHNFPSRVV